MPRIKRPTTADFTIKTFEPNDANNIIQTSATARNFTGLQYEPMEIHMPNDGSYNVETGAGTHPFSIAFWMNCSDTSDNGLSAGREIAVAQADVGSIWSIRLDNAGGFQFIIVDSDPDYSTLTAANSIVVNTWQHVVCTYDPALGCNQ